MSLNDAYIQSHDDSFHACSSLPAGEANLFKARREKRGRIFSAPDALEVLSTPMSWKSHRRRCERIAGAVDIDNAPSLVLGFGFHGELSIVQCPGMFARGKLAEWGGPLGGNRWNLGLLFRV
jgi:hypothetical protein